MTRRIKTENFQSIGPTNPGLNVDGYFDRVIKYIPSDVVGAWVASTGIISSATPASQSNGVLWTAFAFGIVFTALWVWRQTSAPNRLPAITQTLVSTVAFIVWVFALGGPFASFAWYEPYFGSLVLIAFTMSVGLIVPSEA